MKRKLLPKETVPVPLVQSEETSENRVVLLVPRFRRGLLARWLQPRLKRPFVRVRLDEIGSFIWRRLDGQACLAELEGPLAEEFGERVAPAEARLSLFLSHLARSELVRLMVPSEEPAAGAGG